MSELERVVSWLGLASWARAQPATAVFKIGGPAPVAHSVCCRDFSRAMIQAVHLDVCPGASSRGDFSRKVTGFSPMATSVSTSHAGCVRATWILSSTNDVATVRVLRSSSPSPVRLSRRFGAVVEVLASR